MSLTTDRHDGGHDDLTRRGNIAWRGCCSATSPELDHVKDDERDSSGANYAGPRRRSPGAPPHYPPRTFPTAVHRARISAMPPPFASATSAREKQERHACVCFTGLRGEARGRGTRRGRATDTTEPRAAVYTQIKHPVPVPRVPASALQASGPSVNGLRGRGTQTWHACVCYGSTGRGTRTGQGARVGDAQQTRRSHARSCTHKSVCGRRRGVAGDATAIGGDRGRGQRRSGRRHRGWVWRARAADRDISLFHLCMSLWGSEWTGRVYVVASWVTILRRQTLVGRQIFPYFRNIFFMTDQGRLLGQLTERSRVQALRCTRAHTDTQSVTRLQYYVTAR